MLSSIAKPVYILFCALLTVPVALAQENVTSASVSGRVLDPSNQVVPKRTGDRSTDGHQPDPKSADRCGRAFSVLRISKSDLMKSKFRRRSLPKSHAWVDVDGGRGI